MKHLYELTDDGHLVIKIGDIKIGGDVPTIMAGPCSVESIDQISEIAEKVKSAGAHILRGGAFKPRSSPYSFQGLGEEGLEILAEVKKKLGIPIITEALEVFDIEKVADVADIIQIGSRNMHNTSLLKAVGKAQLPVMLKRGMSATIKEFLLAAEYILKEGNQNVILCERGIRTFEDSARNTLDINAIPILKMKTHLPVLVDPSHSTGMREIVHPVSRAAIAAGADGLIVEVHHDRENALCDGHQSLTPEEFEVLVKDIVGLSKHKMPFR